MLWLYLQYQLTNQSAHSSSNASTFTALNLFTEEKLKYIGKISLLF